MAYRYKKAPLRERNVVHLSGAALRLTGYRVFDIFTALGRLGLGRLSIKKDRQVATQTFQTLWRITRRHRFTHHF